MNTLQPAPAYFSSADDVTVREYRTPLCSLLCQIDRRILRSDQASKKQCRRDLRWQEDHIRRMLAAGADPNRAVALLVTSPRPAFRESRITDTAVWGKPRAVSERRSDTTARLVHALVCLGHGFRGVSRRNKQATKHFWRRVFVIFQEFGYRFQDLQPRFSPPRRWVAAVIIQRAWRERLQRKIDATYVIATAWKHAISCPRMLLCKQRLVREFFDLTDVSARQANLR